VIRFIPAIIRAVVLIFSTWKYLRRLDIEKFKISVKPAASEYIIQMNSVPKIPDKKVEPE
jgi:hypothetical protein